MKLVELEPEFVRYEERIETRQHIDGDPATWRGRGCPTKDVTGPVSYSIRVGSLSEAQGIHFLCPKCFATNNGAVGTHWCSVTFANRGALDQQGSHDDQGKPVRWQVSGNSFEDLTTRPSILLVGGYGWHGFITAGEIK